MTNHIKIYTDVYTETNANTCTYEHNPLKYLGFIQKLKLC